MAKRKKKQARQRSKIRKHRIVFRNVPSPAEDSIREAVEEELGKGVEVVGYEVEGVNHYKRKDMYGITLPQCDTSVLVRYREKADAGMESQAMQEAAGYRARLQSLYAALNETLHNVGIYGNRAFIEEGKDSRQLVLENILSQVRSSFPEVDFEAKGDSRE